MSDHYQGVTMLDGKILLPYIPLEEFTEGLGQDEVDIFFSEPFELKGPLAEYKTRILTEKTEKARTAGMPFRDDRCVRLAGYNTECRRLALDLQPIRFSDHEVTNKSLDANIEELDGKTIRQYYTNQNMLDEQLANPIGVNNVLVTSDKHVIITRRSEELLQYPGLMGLPAGFMKPEDATPFGTTQRESKEEICDYKTYVRLIGLGRAADDLHIEILMSGTIDCTRAQAEKAAELAPDRWEAKKLYMVHFDPKSCAPYLARVVKEIPKNVPPSNWVICKSPEWVPAQFMALNMALEAEYGKYEVVNCISQSLKTL